MKRLMGASKNDLLGRIQDLMAQLQEQRFQEKAAAAQFAPGDLEANLKELADKAGLELHVDVVESPKKK